MRQPAGRCGGRPRRHPSRAGAREALALCSPCGSASRSPAAHPAMAAAAAATAAAAAAAVCSPPPARHRARHRRVRRAWAAARPPAQWRPTGRRPPLFRRCPAPGQRRRTRAAASAAPLLSCQAGAAGPWLRRPLARGTCRRLPRGGPWAAPPLPCTAVGAPALRLAGAPQHPRLGTARATGRQWPCGGRPPSRPRRPWASQPRRAPRASGR